MFLKAPKPNQAPGKRPRRAPELAAASKLVYEAKRIRKFVPAWTDHFPWLRYTEEGGEETMYCSTCCNSPDIADTFNPWSSIERGGAEDKLVMVGSEDELED
ncbi:hypothetical protein AAFF_G00397120 [Aldrovandia affinis]|uniref:Uncharacterized protein n=1 Tax=Aldrovandia affinis TaxID=143900 RepID=A0AAD7SD13_9TELE|nr:hypothetical protein AAFF_G00397120 [Aldrovandia affinis]